VCEDDRDLLSADLSGAAAADGELCVCADGGGGAGGWVQALFAVSAGEFAGPGCVAGDIGDGVAGFEDD
jgi:hypothetical protein